MLNRLFISILFGIVLGSVSYAYAGTADEILAGFQKAQKEYLEKNKSIQKPYIFEIMGKPFVGLPDVFSPPLFFDQGSILDILPLKGVNRFLEIGSGTGYVSIMAGLHGVSKVVAVDVNPAAVRNTHINVILHNLEDRITVKESNVFSSLSEIDPFDLIYFDLPFNEIEEENVPYLDRAMYDSRSQALKAYLSEGKKHLKPNGSMVINRSEVLSNMNKFYELAKQYGWELKVLKGPVAEIKITTFQLR